MNYIKYHYDEGWRWLQNHAHTIRSKFDSNYCILKFEVRRRIDKGIDLNRELTQEGTRKLVREHAASLSGYYHSDGVIYYVRVKAGFIDILDEETVNYILDAIVKYHCTMVKPTLDQWREEWDKMDH